MVGSGFGSSPVYPKEYRHEWLARTMRSPYKPKDEDQGHTGAKPATHHCRKRYKDGKRTFIVLHRCQIEAQARQSKEGHQGQPHAN